MEFFNSAIEVLQTLVVALGGGLCVGRHQSPGVPFAFERGTDGGVQRRDLEAFQEVGRHPDRGHAERERPAFLPGDRKYPGKQRLHYPAQSGQRRPQDFGRTAEPVPRPSEVHRQLRAGGRASDF